MSLSELFAGVEHGEPFKKARLSPNVQFQVRPEVEVLEQAVRNLKVAIEGQQGKGVSQAQPELRRRARQQLGVSQAQPELRRRARQQS